MMIPWPQWIAEYVLEMDLHQLGLNMKNDIKKKKKKKNLF